VSFASIFKTIAQVGLTVAGVFVPQLSGVFSRLQTAITVVEANNPVAGAGKLKAEAVIADFEASLALTQEVLALEGKKLVYDATALQTAIDAQVSAYNWMAEVKKSFKVVPL
jgi:hypothetical protein